MQYQSMGSVSQQISCVLTSFVDNDDPRKGNLVTKNLFVRSAACVDTETYI